MNGSLLRTASLRSSILGVLSCRERGSGGFCSFPGSPRISLSMEPCRERNLGIWRVMSENDIATVRRIRGGTVSRSFSSGSIQEDNEDWLSTRCATFDMENLSRGIVDGISSEVTELPGGGYGDGFNNVSGYGHGSGGNESRKLGEYYEKMLKLNPGDPLLLRNYSRYLHEVEGNTERAEEYYGRAILADPGDGEVLSMYAKLIWEERGDGERAKCYHDRAVSASPDNWVVLGSLAQFLWESDKDDEEDMEKRAQENMHEPNVQRNASYQSIPEFCMSSICKDKSSMRSTNSGYVVAPSSTLQSTLCTASLGCATPTSHSH